MKPVVLPSTTGVCCTNNRSDTQRVPVFLIENREIVVGVRHRPGAQNYSPAAEVERHFIPDQQRGRNDLTAGGQVAEVAHQRIEVELARCCKARGRFS